MHEEVQCYAVGGFLTPKKASLMLINAIEERQKQSFLKTAVALRLAHEFHKLAASKSIVGLGQTNFNVKKTNAAKPYWFLVQILRTKRLAFTFNVRTA